MQTLLVPNCQVRLTLNQAAVSNTLIIPFCIGIGSLALYIAWWIVPIPLFSYFFLPAIISFILATHCISKCYKVSGLKIASRYLPEVVERTRHLIERKGVTVCASEVNLVFRPLDPNTCPQEDYQYQPIRTIGPREDYYCVLARRNLYQRSFEIGNYNNSFLRYLISYEELCDYVDSVKQELDSVGPYSSPHIYIFLSISTMLILSILGSIYLYSYLFLFWFFYAIIACGFFEYYYKKAKMSTLSYRLKLVIRNTKHVLAEKGIKATAGTNFIKFVPLLNLT